MDEYHFYLRIKSKYILNRSTRDLEKRSIRWKYYVIIKETKIKDKVERNVHVIEENHLSGK